MSTKKKPERAERRNLAPPGLDMILIGIRRDYERAKDRFQALSVVLTSHTLWEHPDGRNLCDMDGQPWPCSTVVGLAFVYDVKVDEAWEVSR